MKSFSTLLTLFVAGRTVTALTVPRQSTCTFQINAQGSRIVTELGDGQLRVNATGLTTPSFSISSSGGITDNQSRGCVLTPPTTQYQCDAGTPPTTGFSIGSNGLISYNGNSTFYACISGGNGNNIYRTYTPGVETGCIAINLTATACYNSGAVSSSSSRSSSSTSSSSTRASTSSAVTTPTSSRSSSSSSSSSSSRASTTVPITSSSSRASTSSTSSSSSRSLTSSTSSSSSRVSSSSISSTSSRASSSTSSPGASSSTRAGTSSAVPAPSSTGCPLNLPSNYQYPHLIIPVNSASPNTAYGTSYFGTVNSTFSSIFNFDIPASYSGRTCTLVFAFPTQSQLTTSSYTISGNGAVDFKQLNTVATQSTTFANTGSTKTDFGVKNLAPGNAYTITSFSCPAGTALSYELVNAGTTAFRYFQDYNPCPIGLYITT